MWVRWASFYLWRSLLPLGVLLSAAYLSGCGGGAGSESFRSVVPEVVPINSVGAGQFKDAVPIRTISTVEISAAMDLAGAFAFRAVPQYAVQAHRLTYLTQDAQGREILASALIALPMKPANSSSPVLSYQHGTITQQAQAPSNLPDLASPEVVLASQGYIVLAADYVGYGASKTAAHPYLLAAPSAAAVIDLLTAAKYWRQTQRILDNKQIFLAGYSEGAYVTLATQKALEAGTSVHLSEIVSVAAGAGPYNVGRTLDEELKLVRLANPLLGGLLNPGFLRFLSDTDRRYVRDQLLGLVLEANSDVTFSPTVIDNYLADNRPAIESLSNVDDWRATVPVDLFHGIDDRTVAYLVSSGTLKAMQSKGSANFAKLTNCTAVPAGHLECVLPYWRFMLDSFGKLAKNL